MQRNEILAMCREEDHAAAQGWDVSRITQDKRLRTDPLPWDLCEIVRTSMRNAKAFVQMNCADGEFLTTLGNLPIHSFATETSAQNIEKARKKLLGLGVKVSPVGRAEELPFQDDYFHLIVNRHTAYDEDEVLRALRPGGVFITQQIAGTDSVQINQHLELRRPREQLHWNLDYAADTLKQRGFHILSAEEASPRQCFYDVGAVVFFVNGRPWQFPGFSVDRCADTLCGLQRHIETHGCLLSKAQRFLITAQKP